jgi:hypothetical protein
LAFGQASSTVTISNGVELEVTADLGHPTGEEQLTVEMARASGNSFYRIFWDQNKLAVFAYELRVDLASNGESINLTALPCETEFASRYPQADAGKPVPSLSAERALSAIGSGQTALLPLFEIPGMGIHLTDTVRVKLNQAGGSGALHLAGARVMIKGQVISGASPPPSAVSGKFVMFYLPDRGGFFFSGGPVNGRPFVSTGMADRNILRFTVDNEDYEVVASAPIFSNADGGQVWVYHDPAYEPEGNWTQDPHSPTPGVEQFFTAGSDSLGWWLR